MKSKHKSAHISLYQQSLDEDNFKSKCVNSKKEWNERQLCYIHLGVFSAIKGLNIDYLQRRDNIRLIQFTIFYAPVTLRLEIDFVFGMPSTACGKKRSS